MYKILTIGTLTIVGFGLASCASISENDCQTGAWSEYGYKDGLKGRSSDRVADYAKRCSEFGIKPDSNAYLANYERGIAKYCTYEQGYERGENGDSYNQACSGSLAVDFAPGYDAGRVRYEILKVHDEHISEYEDTLDALAEVRRKLKEDELVDGERRRLEKKKIRLKDRVRSQRSDIREFERNEGLTCHSF